LYIKTIERQHLPSQLWEIIPLEKNLTTALAQIDEHLAYWPNYIVNKNKQRLLKITQYLIRMRRLKLQPQEKMRRIDTKLERRERTREEKAEKIAMIDNKIKAELLDRLKQGTYGEIYNFKPDVWNQLLDDEQVSEELEPEFVADEYDNDEEQDRYEEFGGFSSDEGQSQSGEDDQDQNPDLDDFEDAQYIQSKPDKPKAKQTPKSTSLQKGVRPVGILKPDPKTESKKRRRSDAKGKRHLEIEFDVDAEKELA